MPETVTFTPAELFAGAVSEYRRPCTVKSGQNLAANTIVMSDAAGKMVAHDGVTTKKVAGVLIYAVDASAADTAGALYKDGDFITTKLVWPATIDGGAVTDLLKDKLSTKPENYNGHIYHL
jgi:hypothetical protein